MRGSDLFGGVGWGCGTSILTSLCVWFDSSVSVGHLLVCTEVMGGVSSSNVNELLRVLLADVGSVSNCHLDL